MQSDYQMGLMIIALIMRSTTTELITTNLITLDMVTHKGSKIHKNALRETRSFL